MENAISKAKNMFGQGLYQTRARTAFPILVRQAKSKNPIFYENLSTELGMSNPRNLDFVLGSVGATLNELSADPEWGEIPHIQSLVVNKRNRLPGSGFEDFLSSRLRDYSYLTPSEKREYLASYWHEIYAYPYWDDVLEVCDLSRPSGAVADIIGSAKDQGGAGGGEGLEHRRLKEYVAADPSSVGLYSAGSTGKMEVPLPSGDRLDVLFTTGKKQVAVEVKSEISNEVDMTRGLFQCVKYRAVMEAERGFSCQHYSVEAILVLGAALPDSLRPLKNSLGIKVVEVLPGQ